MLEPDRPALGDSNHDSDPGGEGLTPLDLSVASRKGDCGGERKRSMLGLVSLSVDVLWHYHRTGRHKSSSAKSARQMDFLVFD